MKILVWFGRMLLVVTLVSLLSVFTTAYLVDRYVQQLLGQWNMSSVERPSLDMGDFVAKLTHPETLWAGDGAGEPHGAGQGEAEDDSPLALGETTGGLSGGASGRDSAGGVHGDGAGERGGEPAGQSAAAGDSASEGVGGHTDDAVTGGGRDSSGGMPDALPVFGRQTPGALPGELVMSAEEFNAKRKDLTNEDKLAIFSIMMSKLPQNELQHMSLLLEDGITEEELAAVEEVVSAYLSEEDIAKLLAIINKY